MVVWLYIYDSLTDEKKNKKVVPLKDVVEYKDRAKLFLRGQIDTPATPMEKTAMELGNNIRNYMTLSDQEELFGILWEYLEATCTEAGTRVKGVFLEPAEYIDLRNDTSACKPCITGSAMLHPSKLWRTLTPDAKKSFMDIVEIVGRLIWMDNDICGWEREAAENDVMNLVLVKKHYAYLDQYPYVPCPNCMDGWCPRHDVSDQDMT